MSTRRITLVAALVTCLTLALSAGVASAQEATRVGIVNPARVFGEMQETKDLKAKLEGDRKALEGEVQQRQQKVKDLQAARDLLKDGTPQYQEADKTFMKEAIEFDTWSKITQAQLQGQQKQQMKVLFDKIVTATTTVAQQKGVDLVLADQRPELPDNLAQINVEQLRAILNSRNVLFSNAKVDLSNDVIAVLDQQYKAGGGGAASSAPSPAPGGAAAPAPAPAKK